ncbi:hypothetical protein MIB92_05480 [Aestuariirhabdus sp. Z084]|uniref:hypothetical protein n=1 Tax=Aestuariirhabdus haliotis TaxID=2918751 RepID=UPI00201B3B30|nr:hypothetical protein [Aestuariirhabdus haliotis]MCL6415093.1 hypothetical protein [Aestuariirhabdus haliotis]MCL6419025.1 hypothetical protein [Aestuariirhabdus haliotis]
MFTLPTVVTLFYLNKVPVCELPRSAQELSAILGLPRFYTFSKAYGGQTKYIAKNYRCSTLSEILNEDELKALSDIYGGDMLFIPTTTQIDRQVRNLFIKDLIAVGVSQSRIAMQVNLSVRHVNNIKQNKK